MPPAPCRRLTRLDLFTDSLTPEAEADGSTFLDAWTTLGGKIRLESLFLGLNVVPSWKKLVLAALANPDFCPCLRYFDVGGIQWSDMKTQLRKRLPRRDALAEAEAEAAIAALNEGVGGEEDEQEEQM